jgi:hypothetical protein
VLETNSLDYLNTNCSEKKKTLELRLCSLSLYILLCVYQLFVKPYVSDILVRGAAAASNSPVEHTADE